MDQRELGLFKLELVIVVSDGVLETKGKRAKGKLLKRLSRFTIILMRRTKKSNKLHLCMTKIMSCEFKVCNF